MIAGLKTVLGSLTLGGYDSARFAPNDISFSFAPNDSRDLVVGVQAIKYTDKSQNTRDLLNNKPGIMAYVDSTIAEFWLPESSCKAFEDTFGLVYDNVNQLYPINSTWHSTLKAQNPNVTFTLGNEVSGGPTVNIVLPYSAFDLEASWPKYPNNTLYFPLQKAANETQYTLGRTLLQEAFVLRTSLLLASRLIFLQIPHCRLGARQLLPVSMRVARQLRFNHCVDLSSQQQHEQLQLLSTIGLHQLLQQWQQYHCNSRQRCSWNPRPCQCNSGLYDHPPPAKQQAPQLQR